MYDLNLIIVLNLNLVFVFDYLFRQVFDIAAVIIILFRKLNGIKNHYCLTNMYFIFGTNCPLLRMLIFCIYYFQYILYMKTTF